MSGPNAAPEQGLQNYRTPGEFLTRVKQRFLRAGEHGGGFDWDLACDSGNCVADIPGAGYTFDTGVDALAQDWSELAGLTCWMNPPFGQTRLFAAKCASARDVRILALVPVALGTRWWKQHVHNVAHVVGVGRIVFDLPDGSGPVVAWNKKKQVFEPSPINRDCALLAYNVLPKSTPYYLLEDWRDW